MNIKIVKSFGLCWNGVWCWGLGDLLCKENRGLDIIPWFLHVYRHKTHPLCRNNFALKQQQNLWFVNKVELGWTLVVINEFLTYMNSDGTLESWLGFFVGRLSWSLQLPWCPWLPASSAPKPLWKQSLAFLRKELLLRTTEHLNNLRISKNLLEPMEENSGHLWNVYVKTIDVPVSSEFRDRDGWWQGLNVLSATELHTWKWLRWFVLLYILPQ